MVERIRSLLARFSEDETTVRRLVETDARFNDLCDEYRKLVELLGSFEVEIERLSRRRARLEEELEGLRQRRAWLEEELLTRIEGQEPR